MSKGLPVITKIFWKRSSQRQRRTSSAWVHSYFPIQRNTRGGFPGFLMAEQMVKEAALAYGLPFIPLHEEMLKEADRKGYDALTEDGIHLTREGAKIVAGKWMECWRKRRHDNIKI